MSLDYGDRKKVDSIVVKNRRDSWVEGWAEAHAEIWLKTHPDAAGTCVEEAIQRYMLGVLDGTGSVIDDNKVKLEAIADLYRKGEISDVAAAQELGISKEELSSEYIDEKLFVYNTGDRGIKACKEYIENIIRKEYIISLCKEGSITISAAARCLDLSEESFAIIYEPNYACTIKGMEEALSPTKKEKAMNDTLQAYVTGERIATAKAKGKTDGKCEGGSLISLYERGKVSAAEVADKLKISEKIIRIVYNLR